MRAILLGGSGFLGLSIAQTLQRRNVEVDIADRGERLARCSAELGGYRVTNTDAKGLQAIDFASADVLVYLASATLPSTSMVSLSHDAEANITPAVRAFEKAAEAGVRRIVFASSGGTVYGPARKLPIAEDHPTSPISAYGVSKLAVEQYLAIMARMGSVEGISLRVANPYGPYQFRGVGVGAVARFLSCVRAEEPIVVWGDGTVVRDYVHVDDTAAAFAAACETANLVSGEYNIGSGVGFSLNDLVQRITEVCGTEAAVEYRSSRAFDVPEVVLDFGKFRSATGWQPTISFHDGLIRMWEHLQK
jgi:UDP-glucose 4-epimerase